MGSAPASAERLLCEERPQNWWSFDAKTAVYAAPITYERQAFSTSRPASVASPRALLRATHARMVVVALCCSVLPEPEPTRTPAQSAAFDGLAQPSRTCDLDSQYCSSAMASTVSGTHHFPESHRHPALWTHEASLCGAAGGSSRHGMGFFGKDLKPESGRRGASI